MKKTLTLITLSTVMLLSGCATDGLNPLSGGDAMGGGTASLGTPYQQTEAIVIKVRATTIHTAPNGVISSVASNTEGQADGQVAATAGGGMFGGIISSVAGNLIHSATQSAEDAATAQSGIMITVRAKSGTIMSISQAGKIDDFHHGQHVLVDWYGNGEKRIESM